jgi:uncharacterized protein (DUF1330 family)
MQLSARLFAMPYIDPTRNQFRDYARTAGEGPVWMLNLIRLRKKAAYEDKREATGEEAYKAYARESAAFFQGVGGTILWSGSPDAVLIGPSKERWHMAFVAQYPSSEAFMEMVKNPGYQAIVYHRQAAVKTSRLIRIRPGVSGKLFG